MGYQGKPAVSWSEFKISNITHCKGTLDGRPYKLPFKVASHLFNVICTEAKNKGSISFDEIRRLVRAFNVQPYVNAENVDFREYTALDELRHRVIRGLLKAVTVLDKEDAFLLDSYHL